MSIDVYRGRKTTTQQQQQPITLTEERKKGFMTCHRVYNCMYISTRSVQENVVMYMMVSFCAVLFPTRCLGWDVVLNWVSFWGFSFLLSLSLIPTHTSWYHFVQKIHWISAYLFLDVFFTLHSSKHCLLLVNLVDSLLLYLAVFIGFDSKLAACFSLVILVSKTLVFDCRL